MPVVVKICGLCNADDVRAVAALRPDALGFVFWAKSKRAVRAEDVAAWTRGLPAGIWKVGVFVDNPPEEIARIVGAAGLDVVQRHGFQTLEKSAPNFPTIGKNEADFSNGWKNTSEKFPMVGKNDSEFSNGWKNRPPGSGARAVKLWQVVHLGREEPPDESAASVDAFLVDSYSADSPGGTGRVGDWAAAADFVRRCRTPVLLAGGLTPDNVAEALRAVRPWGVDISSGVERAPRRKDLEKVQRFIRTCRESA